MLNILSRALSSSASVIHNILSIYNSLSKLLLTDINGNGNISNACELCLLAISQNIRKAIVKRDTGRLENHILQPASLLNF